LLSSLEAVPSYTGKSTDNPFIKSFNSSLNIHWLLSLKDAQDKLENWRRNKIMRERIHY